MLVVLTDHLDRTERLLVRIGACGFAGPVQITRNCSRRRGNCWHRTGSIASTASNAGDAALAGALDRLEGVLAEIANDPNLTAADLERVRKDMNTEGILFEIRVLLARSSDQESGLNPRREQ